MKVKILAALLGVSVLLNIAGLVFFICFLKVSGSYRAVRRERNVMAQNLTAVRAAGVAAEAAEANGMMKRSFQSLADGQEDMYALMPPAAVSGAKNTLIVYLHGMGSNYLEPFVYPTDQSIARAIAGRFPNTAVLSCSYRKEASWGSDLALSDITQNVRAVLQEYPFERIVLMGTSMGGCTVLLYAACAPPDIKSKITGIVSVEGAGDLQKVYTTTANDQVKYALSAALGGTPEQAAAAYARKSFLPNLDQLPPTVHVAVISAKKDNIVPPPLQQEIVQALDNRRIPARLIEVDAGHGCPPAATYLDGLDFALTKS